MPPVLSYKAKWDLNTHTGKIDIKYWGGQINPQSGAVTTLLPQSPEEMLLLMDLLRNEKPLDYNVNTKQLVSGDWEVIGEGE